MKEYDLIIIGGGAAGFAAAMKADELHAKTLMVNNELIGIGGTCVNVGCLPTKHLLYIGETIHKTKNQNFKGVNSTVSIDFKKIINGKDELIGRLKKDKYEKVLAGLANVDLIEGNAKFISENEVMVEEKSFRAERFVITTGSSTNIPPIKGIDKIDYLTNIEALNLKNLPKSMIILGGGPLAVEFAQMFSRFGTRVTILQRSDRIVKREEPELSNLLRKYLEDEGIEIFTGADIKSIKQEGYQKIVTALVNGEEKTIKAEKLLVATGRRPNISGMGLEEMGIVPGDKGEIVVDQEMHAIGNIWAAGDVTGEPMLETVAAKEGMIAGNNALSDNKIKMDYRIVPHAIFTDPQLASVGYTDEKANEIGYTCRCNTVPMELVPKAQATGDTRGGIKLVINVKTQEILGIHILSSMGADLIHEAAMIIRNKMKVDDVIDTLHVFPTLSEAIKLGAQSFRRDITKMSCCAE